MNGSFFNLSFQLVNFESISIRALASAKVVSTDFYFSIEEGHL
jgi:hypothetical protein